MLFVKKQCRVCGNTKDVSEFYKRTKAKDGYQSRCKECSNGEVKTWRNHNYRHGDPSRVKAKLRHAARQYGLTPERWHALHDAADGKCGICGKETHDLCIDHDHQTGEIRGLLCDPCNTGLGLFKDNPVILRAAIRYLRAASSED